VISVPGLSVPQAHAAQKKKVFINRWRSGSLMALTGIRIGFPQCLELGIVSEESRVMGAYRLDRGGSRGETTGRRSAGCRCWSEFPTSSVALTLLAPPAQAARKSFRRLSRPVVEQPERLTMQPVGRPIGRHIGSMPQMVPTSWPPMDCQTFWPSFDVLTGEQDGAAGRDDATG